MKVVAYLRVSTDAQAEKGQGLPEQRDAIQSWAKSAGHRIIAMRADEGISGSNGLESRVALADALSDVRSKRAGGLVVYRLDRLARDLILQETLLAEVWSHGGEVFSTSTAESDYLQDDPGDPSRKLIRQILGAVAEYERAMIRLRMQAGRERKRQQGRYIGGRPPYGYRAEGRELVPDSYEQSVIARAREMRAGGFSLQGIADGLGTEGYQPRTSSVWSREMVRRIVRAD